MIVHNVARVVHFDIKPENILIDKTDTVKIADFGISKMMNKEEEFKKVGGTRMFLPPETWKVKKFKGKPIDIWAIGVTFYYLAFGYYPFSSVDPTQFNKTVESTEVKFPAEADPQYVDLLKRCLVKDPEARITLDEIFEHGWVTRSGQSPLEKCGIGEHITVTRNEIEKAFTVRKIEVNMFAVTRVRTLLKSNRKITRTPEAAVGGE